MKFLFLMGILLISSGVFAQDENGKNMEGTIRIKKIAVPERVDSVYSFTDMLPQFKGGNKGLTKFIRKNLKYPRVALEEAVQGKVVIAFIIDKDGTVNNIEVLKSICTEIDNEAIRLVLKMPKWKPAEHNGNPVTFKMKMPVEFAIQQ